MDFDLEFVNFESMCPGFESWEAHEFFFFFFFFLIFFYVFFFCHYNYSANLHIQHDCLYSVSPTFFLPLMMSRPPTPSAL